MVYNNSRFAPKKTTNQPGFDSIVKLHNITLTLVVMVMTLDNCRLAPAIRRLGKDILANSDKVTWDEVGSQHLDDVSVLEGDCVATCPFAGTDHVTWVVVVVFPLCNHCKSCHERNTD